MVTVTDISTIRSSACVLLDNGEKYWLRRDDLPAAGIREGLSCEQEDFLQRVRPLQYPRALNHAVAMLARRPCSTGEIRSRLIRLRYTEEVAELVLYKLDKEKLLDDQDFCLQWIRSRTARRYGPAVIRRELRMKGIPESMIEEALEQAGQPEEEEDNALVLARKAWSRIRPSGDVRKDRQKVIASLVRKGYDWDTARSVCETAEQEHE